MDRGRCAASLMRSGFAERGLLGEQADLLDVTIERFDFLALAARTELAGHELPSADNDRLRFIGAELAGFAMRTGDLDELGGVDRDQDSAIVAHIATEGFQVAVGAVFAFHTFVSETGERLDDDTWRAILDAGAAPARPGWQEVLFAR